MKELVTFRTDKKKLKKEADKQRRSLSNLLNFIIDKYFGNAKK